MSISKTELAALDALCCAMDEERPSAAVTASAWGLGMNSAGRMPVSMPDGPGPVSAAQPLCVWCAVERAIRGQPAPRINGDVWLHPCPRHEARPEIQRSNPNAGVVPAYPRGRWS